MGGRASHMAGVLFPRPVPVLYCCLHNKVHSPRPDLRALCHLAPLTSPASPPPFNQPCDSPSITQTRPIFPASRLCLMLSRCILSPTFFLSDLLYPSRVRSNIIFQEGGGTLPVPQTPIAHLWPFLWPCRPICAMPGVCVYTVLGTATFGLLHFCRCSAPHLSHGKSSVQLCRMMRTGGVGAYFSYALVTVQ